jgi:two-component system osmolarity sensor histidine kinase EnvZ
MAGPIRLLKRILPRGLFGRALLIIVIPLVLVQVVSTYVFYTNHWDTMTRRLANSVAGDIAAVIAMLRTESDLYGRGRVQELADRYLQLRISVVEGGILSGESVSDSDGEGALAAAMSDIVNRPFSIDSRLERDVLVTVQLPEGLLEVTVPRKRLSSSTTYVFVLWMVGTSLLLFGIATLFMRNQVRAVRRLAAAADSFGKGREVANFKPEGATEVRQAAVAFNLMRERLKRQIDQRTEMLAGVSHDLRTPLTRMKLQLAMMGNGDGTAELHEDVADMERMVEGYLAFARGEGSENIVPTDVVALLEDVVARQRRNGGSIDLHCEGELTMPLRPHAMSRCLANLIGNAARYAGHVAVRAGHRGDAVEIMVDDDGPGIPADKREEVFKAFVRLDSSRNPQTGGVGLGLTIARDVVRGHGGDILLEQSPMGGLRARVRLPL